jgi:hypothetical protein
MRCSGRRGRYERSLGTLTAVAELLSPSIQIKNRLIYLTTPPPTSCSSSVRNLDCSVRGSCIVRAAPGGIRLPTLPLNSDCYSCVTHRRLKHPNATFRKVCHSIRKSETGIQNDESYIHCFFRRVLDSDRQWISTVQVS